MVNPSAAQVDVADADLQRRVLHARAQVPPIFEVGDHSGLGQHLQSSIQSVQLSKISGSPERGKSPMMIGRNALIPVRAPPRTARSS